MSDETTPYTVAPNRRTSEFPWRKGDTAEIGDRGADGWKAVKVMAVADGYAMVRIPFCMPFVVSTDELRAVACGSRGSNRTAPTSPCGRHRIGR